MNLLRRKKKSNGNGTPAIESDRCKKSADDLSNTASSLDEWLDEVLEEQQKRNHRRRSEPLPETQQND